MRKMPSIVNNERESVELRWLRRCFQVRGRGWAVKPSSAMSAITYTAVVQAPLTSQQGKARQGGISASGETKFILNQPRQPRSRTMPANSTARVPQQPRERRCRFDAPTAELRLSTSAQRTQADRSGASTTRRWAGKGGDKQRSKAKWETGASREEVREGWSSRRW